MIIRMSRNIQDLTGEGTELLLDQDDNVLAEFYDGNIVHKQPLGNTSDTLSLA